MKIKKNTAIMMGFIIGASMFITTAIADIASKSGYDKFKDILKITSHKCSREFSSFTIDGSIVIKDNGKIINSGDSTQKYDNLKTCTEEFEKNYKNGKTEDSYYYRDRKESINKNYNEKVYTVYEKQKEEQKQSILYEDPFKESETKDIERIIDALAGNLKDYVVVSEDDDGGAGFSGSLKEAQIPSIVNALVSYLYKRESSYDSSQDKNKLRLVDDVFIKEGSLKAIASKDNVLKSIFVTGTLSGKDKDGEGHDITIELLGKLRDINTTVINKPDLAGKKVEKIIIKDENQPTIDKKYEGRYKNNIILEKGGQFIKIGERIVDIEKVDGKTVEGRYDEEYKKGYEKYSKGDKEFSFTANLGTDNTGYVDHVNGIAIKDKYYMSFNSENVNIYFEIYDNSHDSDRFVHYSSEYQRQLQ